MCASVCMHIVCADVRFMSRQKEGMRCLALLLAALPLRQGLSLNLRLFVLSRLAGR